MWGANVIDKITCKNKFGSDKNKYLIALLNHMKNGGALVDEVSREEYNKVRDFYNGKSEENFPDWYVGNVGFLASYNGRFFDGGYSRIHYEKTKNGKKLRNRYAECKRNLEKQAEKLKDTMFFVEDVEQWDLNKLDNVKDVVFYFDPPYIGTRTYDVSRNFNYDKFYDICRKLSQNNIVIVSEVNMPEDFSIIWEKSVSRSIDAINKTHVIEKLYTIGSGLDFNKRK